MDPQKLFQKLAKMFIRKMKRSLFLKLYLLALLPADTEIITTTGSAIGSSNRVNSKLTLDKNITKSIGKKLVGDAMFYQKHYTKNAPGDLLLTPQRLGEIAIIELKNSSKYILRRDAFLAKTNKVTMDLGINSSENGLINKLVHTVSGPGTLAISHYGGIYRISLAAGEEYKANPRNLIMWDKRTNPTQLHSKQSIVPSPRSHLRKYEVFRNIVDSPSLQPKLQYVQRLSRYIFNLILGTPDFVKLKGPGDFYLASRVEPRFETSRLMNALTSINDSARQIFDQQTIDMFPAPPSDTISQITTKKKQHPGYAQKSSVDGYPSYYAEVHKGDVSFVPAKQE
ncbi:mitochondrial biogenesis AIM24-domain-containing protein [Cokeromyces recurvatus]|uniref:mitochondrial biogenesis AIM24-domain-containing protein n=1 Tax=Cokeromyces recurvatus TaxID=90255 RepID=UPI00221EF91E|nr:mitochondrial biogenesis AIM24-domain-containing protein [Cokeromyces recurvatus]KAI7901382.1 mitochondrial biogenesis AIM24-domain-containing protein [Cokeromyces recurvatus]